MKTFRKTIPVLLMSLLCASCANAIDTPPVEDYFSELAYHDNFKIMAISDLHFSCYDNLAEDFAFLDLLKNEADPDLIIIDGDIFTFASKYVVKEVFNHFESYNIPWTFTYGNHDEQIYASPTFASEYANTLDNCLFRFYNDTLSGQSNNIINLMKGDEVAYQIFAIDSNSYTYIDKIGYDLVHEDQIEWYKNAITKVNKDKYGESWKVGDETIDSLIFQHIPVPEYADALEEYKKDESIGEGWNRESISAPKTNSGFFDVIKEYGSTKGMIVGHDHVNNYDILYEGVHMIYGAKGTDNMYHDDDMLGYRLITIESETSFSTSCHYHKYGELK